MRPMIRLVSTLYAGLLPFVAVSVALLPEILPIGLLACGSSPSEAQSPPPREALAGSIAASCPMRPGAVAEPFDAPQVFTEIALFEAPKTYVPHPSDPIAKIADDPSFAFFSSPHILATQGIPATIDVGKPPSANGPRAGGLHVSILAHVDGDAVRMKLEINEGESTLATTVVGRDQKPVILSAPRGAKSLVAIVTPYVIRGQSDLKQIVACKEEQLRRARQK